jgi:hypothetical protein
VAQPRFLAPVSSSRAGCGRLPTPALPNSRSQAKPAVYARERRGSLPLPGLASSRFGCWLRGPSAEYRAIIGSGGSRGLLQVSSSTCRRCPAYAPLLLLLRLMRRLVAPSTRSEVTGTSSDLAACLVAVLPAGVVVDRSGPPQAPTDGIEQHAGPRESIEPAGDVAGVRQADHAVDSGNRALANRFPRHTIQSTKVTRERGTL